MLSAGGVYMACNLQITYLGHSAFAVRTPDTILVFDDAAGTPDDEDPLSAGRVSRALLASHQHIFFFVSRSFCLRIASCSSYKAAANALHLRKAGAAERSR